METIGLSKSTQHMAEPDRRGFWPWIADSADATHWIYTGAGMVLMMAAFCIIVSAAKGNPASAAIEAAFLILGAAGIVCRNPIAAAATAFAFAQFAVLMGRYNPYSFVGLIPATLAIIHAVRSVWFLNGAGQSLPPLNRNRFLNALAGPLPKALWGAGRFVFYSLAAAGLPWLVYRIFAPIAPGAKWRGVVEFPWM